METTKNGGIFEALTDAFTSGCIFNEIFCLKKAHEKKGLQKSLKNEF